MVIKMTTYRVATFNLKNDMPLTRKFLRWDTRKHAVMECIRYIDADILGVQEYTIQMARSLSPLKNIYTSVGAPRNKNPNDKSERTDIFYKKEKFNCLEYRTFWLSNHPDRKGSRLFFSPFPRICTMAKLEDKKTKNILWVFNTHLDHLLPFNRSKETEILIETIRKENDIKNIILMGDLNTNIESSAVKKLLNNPTLPLFSVYHHINPSNTMHYGSGRLKENKLPIDYIFVGKEFKINSTEIIKEEYEGLYPSDHYPVVTEIEFK